MFVAILYHYYGGTTVTFNNGRWYNFALSSLRLPSKENHRTAAYNRKVPPFDSSFFTLWVCLGIIDRSTAISAWLWYNPTETLNWWYHKSLAPVTNASRHKRATFKYYRMALCTPFSSFMACPVSSTSHNHNSSPSSSSASIASVRSRGHCSIKRSLC